MRGLYYVLYSLNRKWSTRNQIQLWNDESWIFNNEHFSSWITHTYPYIGWVFFTWGSLLFLHRALLFFLLATTTLLSKITRRRNHIQRWPIYQRGPVGNVSLAKWWPQKPYPGVCGWSARLMMLIQGINWRFGQTLYSIELVQKRG